MRKQILYKFFIPLLLILISGCSSTNERPEYRERSLAAIYNNAVYNLDAPLVIQYRDYMFNLVQGDFGPSFRYPGRSVTEMIFTGLPVTFELAFYAIIIAMLIGSLAGILAAVKRNTLLDYIPMTIAMIGICMPTFLLGPLLVLYFGIHLEASR